MKIHKLSLQCDMCGIESTLLNIGDTYWSCDRCFEGTLHRERLESVDWDWEEEVKKLKEEIK